MSTPADTYEAALARSKGNIAHCDDAALMASFLSGSAHILIGAVSARLVWQGSPARGLTTKELTQLIHLDPLQAAELMWVTS
jgi:hypothetical protein